MADELKKDDILVIGIAAGDDVAGMKRFLEKAHLTFPTFADPSIPVTEKGQTVGASRALAAFKAQGWPSFVVIDRHGKVTALNIRMMQDAKSKAKKAAKS